VCAPTERKPCGLCVRKGVDVLYALPPAKFPLFLREGHSILFYSPWLDLLHRSSNNQRNRLKNAEFPTKPISTPATIPHLLSTESFTTNTQLIEHDTTPTFTSTDPTTTKVELASSSNPDPIPANFNNVSTTSDEDTFTTNTQLIKHDTTPTFTSTDPTSTKVELASSSNLDPIPASFNNVSTTSDDETTTITPAEFDIESLPEMNMNSVQTTTLDPTISVTDPIPSTTPPLFETFPLTVPETSNKNWTNVDSHIPLHNFSGKVDAVNTTLVPVLKADLILNKTLEKVPDKPENFFTFVQNFITKCKILLLIATLIRPNITLETRLALRGAVGIILSG
jgi:hypothetical protein